jgi:hypothetical protein
LELKYEEDYWNTYKGTTEREMRLNIADFHKLIDIQAVWRPKAKFRQQAPFQNPNKLGNASAFGIPTVSFPEPNYIREFDRCFIQVDSIKRMVKVCDRLKNDRRFYNWYARHALARAENYHIDNVSKLYLNLT